MKTINAAAILVIFFNQHALAQQNTVEENISPIHSLIFIYSVLFFIAGFILLIVLKIREDAKSRKDEDVTNLYHQKNRHHHPNHYGHHHQYHH